MPTKQSKDNTENDGQPVVEADVISHIIFMQPVNQSGTLFNFAGELPGPFLPHELPEIFHHKGTRLGTELWVLLEPMPQGVFGQSDEEALETLQPSTEELDALEHAQSLEYPTCPYDREGW